MAVVHCIKCNRELWFIPTRRRRKDFTNVTCACGVRFIPRETHRVKRVAKSSRIYTTRRCGSFTARKPDR